MKRKINEITKKEKKKSKKNVQEKTYSESEGWDFDSFEPHGISTLDDLKKIKDFCLYNIHPFDDSIFFGLSRERVTRVPDGKFLLMKFLRIAQETNHGALIMTTIRLGDFRKEMLANNSKLTTKFGNWLEKTTFEKFVDETGTKACDRVDEWRDAFKLLLKMKDIRDENQCYAILILESLAIVTGPM